MKQEGAPANFRPIDDVFDDAVTTLTSQIGKNTPPDLQLSRHDLAKFTSMKCVASAAKHLCEVKGIAPPPLDVKSRLCGSSEITPDISVYRFSMQTLVNYLRKKVARLIAAKEFRESLTVVRLLAKDGLMEDGKEALLEGELYSESVKHLVETFLAGCLKAACDLVAHHLPPDVKTEMMSTYEYVCRLLRFCRCLEFSSVSRPWTFT